jgi:hypothetical protein
MDHFHEIPILWSKSRKDIGKVKKKSGGDVGILIFFVLSVFGLIIVFIANANTFQSHSNQLEQKSEVIIESQLNPLTQEIIRSEVLRRIKAGKIYREIGGYSPIHYPSELIVAVIKARHSEDDEDLNIWINSEIDNLRLSLEKYNYYHVWPGHSKTQTFGENTQTRLVLGLAEIYDLLPSQRTQTLLIESYFALKNLPELKVRSSVTGKIYLLPSYSYINTSKPKVDSYRTLDPNHDATLAAAYWKTAMSGALSLRDSTIAKKKAKEYFLAALDLTDSRAHRLTEINGCLPLADQLIFKNSCDTRYNAFWLHWMLKMQDSLGNKESLSLLRGAYKATRSKLLSFQTYRTYPFVLRGNQPDPVEATTSLIAVARFEGYQVNQDFVKKLNIFFQSNSNRADKWPITYLFP